MQRKAKLAEKERERAERRKQTLAAFCQHYQLRLRLFGGSCKRSFPPSPPSCLPAHTDNNVDTQRRMHALFALNRARVVRIAVVVVAVVLLAYCCSWKVGYVVVIAVVSLIHPRAISCSN